MAEKKRLDCAVFEAGFVESRERAKTAIMAGIVFVNGQREDKPGTMIKADAKIELRGETLRYVSRGGLKLEKAMQCFPIDLTDCVCVDIGASTGGFTDCMLQNGAKLVYAVDVGYGQLAWKLRTDPRVVNLERTHICKVTENEIDQPIDFCSIDVSFISLTRVLPVAKRLLHDNGSLVCLIKPQFEAGREKVGKKGVVRDPAVHREVIEKIVTFLGENGFSVCGLDFSPVKGPEGNIEYLAYAKTRGEKNDFTQQDIAELVAASHKELG